MKRIIILTGSELRHTFFRKYVALSENINVVATYCEGLEKSLKTITKSLSVECSMREAHLVAREASENDFFGTFCQTNEDFSQPIFLPKGDINNASHVKKIISLDPDVIVAYGCSIIREPLLSVFGGRFVNVHLGLSPYYRGSGTNFWPLVNKEPEFVGATFMHIDSGIDTGEIIHQIRADYFWGDTPSSIGNRLILKMSATLKDLILNFDNLHVNLPKASTCESKVYKKIDFSEQAVQRLYQNMKEGLVENYLIKIRLREKDNPIIVNPTLGFNL